MGTIVPKSQALPEVSLPPACGLTRAGQRRLLSFDSEVIAGALSLTGRKLDSALSEGENVSSLACKSVEKISHAAGAVLPAACIDSSDSFMMGSTLWRGPPCP
jgi:hypothetical protein